MESSKKQFDNLNRELINKLIPDKNLPIYGNSFIDCNDPIFDKSFEEIEKIKYETLLDIIEYQEWNLKFEEIKNNLNIE